jgi:hypothetical protein
VRKREKERERFVCTSCFRDEAQACVHMYVEIGICVCIRTRTLACTSCLHCLKLTLTSMHAHMLCPEEATLFSCGLAQRCESSVPSALFLLATSSLVSWLLSRIASARLVASSGVPRIPAGSSSRLRSRSVQSSNLSLMTAGWSSSSS